MRLLYGGWVSRIDKAAQYATGPTFVLAVALLYNAVAVRRGRPTISTSIRWLGHHPFGAWVAGGIIGGLLAHWFIEQEAA